MVFADIKPQHMESQGLSEFPPFILESRNYLVDAGYISTVTNFVESGEKSARVTGFAYLTEAQKIAKNLFQVDTLVPQVTVLTDKLWREWLSEGHQFTRKTEQALTDIVGMALSSSENEELALRHAFFEPGEKSSGLSLMQKTTVDEVLSSVNEQYQDRLSKGWDQREDAKVILNLQEFTNPKSSFSFDYPETDREAPVFSNGTPPIGGFMTTSAENNTITIKMVYGDNRAAQLNDEICDIITFEVIEKGENHTPTLKMLDRLSGKREYIVLDRGNKLINAAKLPPEMSVGPIDISDLELNRLAAFAYAATKVKEIEGDIRVEFSLGHRGFYFNELEPWVPRETPSPDTFEKEYRTLLVVNHLEDVNKLADLPINLSLPGAIYIGENIQKLSSTEIGHAVQQIENVISERKSQTSNVEEQTFWDQLIYVTLGNEAEHRTVNAISVANHNYLALSKLPPILAGDLLSPLYRDETDTYWLQNNSISGDRKNVINASACYETPSRELIGPKAYNVELLRKHNIWTPPPIFLTSEAFIKILKTNRVYEDWKNLYKANRPEELAEAFSKIRNSLNTISPFIWKQITHIIKRQFPDWETMLLVARSSNLVEDVGIEDSGNLAGSFDSFLKLKLNYHNNRAENYDAETGKPTDLATAILEVIKSSFRPELANSIWTNNEEQRQALFQSWKMPVLIMPQVDGLASGVIFRNNQYAKTRAQIKNEIVITMNPGLEGGVRANDERPTFKFVVPRDNTSAIRASVRFQPNHDFTSLPLDQLSRYLNPKITPSHIIGLAKNSTNISDDIFHKPQDIEFVLGSDGHQIIVQTRDQKFAG